MATVNSICLLGTVSLVYGQTTLGELICSAMHALVAKVLLQRRLAGHASFIVINNHMNTLSLKLEPFSSSESAFYPTLLFLSLVIIIMSPAS